MSPVSVSVLIPADDAKGVFFSGSVSLACADWGLQVSSGGALCVAGVRGCEWSYVLALHVLLGRDAALVFLFSPIN